MSILLAPLPVQSFRDSNGNPLAGGLLYTYQAGTSTLQTTYTDATGATPNANPVVLNSRGEASVWLTSAQAFKLVLQDSYGVLIWSVDQVASGASSGANSDILSLSGLTTPLSVSQGGTGASTPAAAIALLGAAASGTNNDIASLGFLAAINGGQIAGNRNRIVNGDTRIWQRGTTFSGIGAGLVYTADRFMVACNGGTVSVGQGGTVPGGYLSLSINGAAGVSNVQVQTRLESLNVYDLGGTTISVSGYVFQSTGTPMTTAILRVFRANTVDNFAAVTQESANYTLPSIPNASWTYFKTTFTVSNPAANGISITLDSGTPILAGQAFATTLWQCEKGSTATAFEYRDYPSELVRCQRTRRNYAAHATEFNGNVASGSTYFANYYWTPPMRSSTPVIVNTLNAGNNAFAATVGTFSANQDGAYESRVCSTTSVQSNFGTSFGVEAEL